MSRKKWIAAGICAGAFLMALGLTLYPLISNYYNERHASKLHTEYQDTLEKMDTSAVESDREAARRYNAALIPGAMEVDAYSSAALEAAAEDYADILNPAGNGLMGYLNIPCLSVELPIYHGTADATLEIGVGHLLGSSLPVGGESTHAILSGHSGMAGNKMLSDLPQMKLNDVFYLEVLGETLAYQVDQIKTVLPSDTKYLGITTGEDYCTLVTCTPFGINTHRLLVRGSRIPYVEEEILAVQDQGGDGTESDWTTQYRKGILDGTVTAIVLLLIYAIAKKLRKRRTGSGKYER